MRSRNPGTDADHVQMFSDGGRVEVWNDGEVCVYDSMDRDLDDFYIVQGDVPKLIRLLGSPLARWHHFMRDMVEDDVSLVPQKRRRRRNPSSYHAQIRAILSKARSNPMSRLRSRSRKAARGSRRGRKALTRKQRKAARKAAWRKLQAKRRGRKTSRVARKSRYSRKAVRRTTKRRSVRRTSRRYGRKARRTTKRTSRRYSRKAVRRGKRGRAVQSSASIYTFADAMAPGGDFFGMGVNPRRRGKRRGRRNPGVHHFKGGMVSYQDDGAVTMTSDRGMTREYELDGRGMRRFLPKVKKLKTWKGVERALGSGAILRQVNPKRRRRNSPLRRRHARALKHVLRSHGYKCNPKRSHRTGRFVRR